MSLAWFIPCAIKKTLTEAPGSYKDIETVMEQQSDLVAIAVSLLPLAVVKG
jgi:tRNA-splicing ligase RtcB (3'-phosphate/5'-hydroxy nucleic acid ligase)